VTHGVIVVLAALGIAGQLLAGLFALAAGAAAVGVRRPFASLRAALWGYELWAAFVVSAVATGGSLFFSEVAHFVPCELCWYQRICMYPLSLITLLAAIRGDFRVARYLLALPLVGACVSVYHLLVENAVVGQSSACLVSAPGGCSTKWIDEFGYVTIPTLALTGFVLLIELLGLAALSSQVAEATVVSDV
jgi:disulfide bond formation protein DsbB